MVLFCLFVFSVDNSQTLKGGGLVSVECPSMEVFELGWTRAYAMTSDSAGTGWNMKIPANLNCPVTL